MLVVIVQIQSNKYRHHHQPEIISRSGIDTVTLNVLAVVALVKRNASRKFICFSSPCDMVNDVLNKTICSIQPNHSRRRFHPLLTNESCAILADADEQFCYDCFHFVLNHFECRALNFINFSYATITVLLRSPQPPAAMPFNVIECDRSQKLFIPNERNILRITTTTTTNILSFSSTRTILFPVSTERQLVIIFCIVEYRKDFITTQQQQQQNFNNNIMNNNQNVVVVVVVPDNCFFGYDYRFNTDAMVKYLANKKKSSINNNTIYNLILFIAVQVDCRLSNIFTTLYLANYDLNLLILSLFINYFYCIRLFSVQSLYYYDYDYYYDEGKLIRYLILIFMVQFVCNTKWIANRNSWMHMMRSAAKNSMIFALWY